MSCEAEREREREREGGSCGARDLREVRVRAERGSGEWSGREPRWRSGGRRMEEGKPQY